MTTKLQKRRDNFLREKHPEYKGNSSHASTEETPRRGRRLGGSFADPSRPILKLDGSESFCDSKTRGELEEIFVSRLEESRNNPQALSETVSEFHERINYFADTREPVSAQRDRVIKSMSSVDYQVLSGDSSLPDAHHHRILTKNKFITASLAGTHSQRSPRSSSQALAIPRETDNTFPILREEQDMFPETAFHESVMTRDFVSQSLSMVDIHNTSVPAVVRGTLTEYKAAKTDSIIFDVSYKRKFNISGSDAVLAMDHFISAPVRNLAIGDATHACILDTKGYIMSLCLVSRLAAGAYSVVIDGNNTDSVFRYMAQYIVYSRQSGLDVSLQAIATGGTFIMYGPNTLKKLRDAIDEKLFLGSDLPLPSTDHILGMPPMCTITTDFFHLTRLSKDRFLVSLVGDETKGKEFLAKLAPFGGAYALDMLRMESGDTRPGIDIPASSTPVCASLSHLVDQRKVREKILFGHERIAKELLKQPSYKRVGIVASKYTYAGCRILSAPHRFPIGEITSCTWSPTLNKRVCQAYVKPDFAIERNPVLINLPHEIPDSIDYRFRRRIVKQGNLQSVFRRLIPGTVIKFPIEDEKLENGDPWLERDDIFVE